MAQQRPTENTIAESLDSELALIESRGELRELRSLEGVPGPRMRVDGREVLQLCSNDYLGLAGDSRVRQAAADAAHEHGAGAGSSRLVSGTLSLHLEFERAIAEFKGSQAALLFGSGFLANVGVLTALADKQTVIYSDALNHASIIDGSRLSGAQRVVYRHCDPQDLESKLASNPEAKALVVTDGVFSMDGDLAPLPEIVEVCKRHGAMLVVDDAHGTGTVGPGGRGSVAHFGLEDEVDVVVGTLGKSLGSSGAFISCSRQIRSWMINRARSFIFSTAAAPPSVGAALRALEILQSEPDRVSRLQNKCRLMRSELESYGVSLAIEGIDLSNVDRGLPIIPLVVGDPQAAMAATGQLLEQGFFVQGIRAPSVARGSERLRLTVSSEHGDDELRTAADAIARTLASVGGSR